MTASLLINRHPGVVVATLNRPEKRNAMGQELIDELHALSAELEADPSVLILCGSGGNFAAGADIAQLRDRTSVDAYAGINTRCFMRVRALPMPVIAALEGYTLGGGAELAYAADIRIGTESLRIGNPEPGLGIIAGAGASWRLREIVGEPVAAQMLLTGQLLTGAEAHRVGLITELVDAEALLERAMLIAEQITKLDPAAIQATKRAFQAPIAAHPRIDYSEQARLFDSPEKHRRMTEFLERKARA